MPQINITAYEKSKDPPQDDELSERPSFYDEEDEFPTRNTKEIENGQGDEELQQQDTGSSPNMHISAEGAYATNSKKKGFDSNPPQIKFGHYDESPQEAPQPNSKMTQYMD